MFGNWVNIHDVGRVLRNRNYLYLLVGLFFLSLTLGMRAAFNNYMNIYFWEFDTSLIANLVFGSIIGYGIDDFLIVHVTALTIGHFNHANFRPPIGPLPRAPRSVLRPAGKAQTPCVRARAHPVAGPNRADR